jgi:hypothetical protein
MDLFYLTKVRVNQCGNLTGTSRGHKDSTLVNTDTSVVGLAILRREVVPLDDLCYDTSKANMWEQTYRLDGLPDLLLGIELLIRLSCVSLKCNALSGLSSGRGIQNLNLSVVVI